MAQAKRKEEPVESGTPELVGASSAAVAEVPFEVPQPLSRNTIYILAGLVVLFNLPLIHYYLLRGAAPTTTEVPFSDTYEDPMTVSKNYFSTGGHWRTVQGWLFSPGVKNNPLWLKAKLPQNVSVEFDVKSQSQEGDIKCEIFGDGTDHASGYVLIHGGWNNSMSVIARLDEHGAPMAQLQQEANRIASEKKLSSAGLKETGVFTPTTRMRVEAPREVHYPVQIGKTYHWRIERRGSLLTWFIDGAKYMEFDDPFPLVGSKHDRFAFSSWEADLYFDNLKIAPL
jgi:hypothetical protein